MSCSLVLLEGHGRRHSGLSSAVVGSPVIVNGDEYENIELKQSGSEILSSRSGTAVVVSVAGSAGGAVKRDVDNNISADAPPLQAASTSESVVPVTDTERQRDSSSGYTSESGDMLRELVKNKDQIEVPRRKPPVKMGSADSEVSDTSNLASILLTLSFGRPTTVERLILYFAMLLNLSVCQFIGFCSIYSRNSAVERYH